MCLLNSKNELHLLLKVTLIRTGPQEMQTVQQLVTISLLRADVKHLSYTGFMTILRPNPQPRLFFNLRVFMLELNCGQERFLIPAYTWFSFDAGMVCSNIFLRIMVNLELGRGNKRYLLLLFIVLGKLLFYPWSRHLSRTDHLLIHVKKSWFEEQHWTVKEGFFPRYSATKLLISLPLHSTASARPTAFREAQCCKGKSHS